MKIGTKVKSDYCNKINHYNKRVYVRTYTSLLFYYLFFNIYGIC